MAFSFAPAERRTGPLATWWRTSVTKAAALVRPVWERVARLVRHNADTSEEPAGTTTATAPPELDTGDRSCLVSKPARVLSLAVAALMAVSSRLGLLVRDLYQ